MVLQVWTRPTLCRVCWPGASCKRLWSIQVCEEHLLVYICKPTTKNGFSILLYSCLNVVVDIRNLFPISSECISSVCPTPTGHVRGHRRNRELCFLTPTTVAGAGQGLWLSVFINGPCRAEWQQGDRSYLSLREQKSHPSTFVFHYHIWKVWHIMHIK